MFAPTHLTLALPGHVRVSALMTSLATYPLPQADRPLTMLSAGVTGLFFARPQDYAKIQLFELTPDMSGSWKVG